MIKINVEQIKLVSTWTHVNPYIAFVCVSVCLGSEQSRVFCVGHYAINSLWNASLATFAKSLFEMQYKS